MSDDVERERARYEALAALVDNYRRERDEARAEVEQMQNRCAHVHGGVDQALEERDEARAEVERLKSESKIEQAFTNKYIKRLHDAEAKCADAYRRGAEAMREACAMLVLTSNAVHGRVNADALRALPIPEET